MKEIHLSNGNAVFVDDEDFESLNQYNWHLDNWGYAQRHIRLKDGRRSTSRMHRDIMCPDGDFVVDHINRNKLDNRRENLRVCTQGQNRINSCLQSNNSSGFKGVAFSKKDQKWVAYIKLNGKRKHLGIFKEKEDAISARKNAESIYHGEFSIGPKIEEPNE